MVFKMHYFLCRQKKLNIKKCIILIELQSAKVFFIKSRTKRKFDINSPFTKINRLLKSVMRACFKKGKCNEIDCYRTTIVSCNERTRCCHLIHYLLNICSVFFSRSHP